MGVASSIQWTDNTFNPWRGCSKVHTGCTNCYAEAQAKRFPVNRGVWGPNGTRVVAAAAAWKEPIKWNREAEEAGKKTRVFCASLADVFEDWQGPVKSHTGQSLGIGTDGKLCFVGERLAELSDIRRKLFALIDSTPNLIWQILTKRPENVRRMWGGSRLRKNVHLLYSASDQPSLEAGIIPLLNCRDLVTVIGLSCEPLVGKINLRKIEIPGTPPDAIMRPIHECREIDALQGQSYHPVGNGALGFNCPKLDWVIIGGESGPHARRCRPEWIRSIALQCKSANVPVFVKQLGGNVVTRNDNVEDEFNNLENGWPDPEVEHDINGFRENYQGADCRIVLRDKKGGDWDEWPADLRIREFPREVHA